MHTGARIPQIAGHSTRSLDRFPSRLSVRVIQIRKACKYVFRYFAIHVSAGVTMIAADMIGVSRVQGRDASVVEQETWIRHWLSTGHDTICSHSFNIFHMRNSAASPLCLTAKGNYFYPSQPPENFHPFQSSQLPSLQSSPTSRHRQSFHASLEKLRAKSLYPHTEELDTEPNSCLR